MTSSPQSIASIACTTSPLYLWRVCSMSARLLFGKTLQKSIVSGFLYIKSLYLPNQNIDWWSVRGRCRQSRCTIRWRDRCMIWHETDNTAGASGQYGWFRVFLFQTEIFRSNVIRCWINIKIRLGRAGWMCAGWGNTLSKWHGIFVTWTTWRGFWSGLVIRFNRYSLTFRSCNRMNG